VSGNASSSERDGEASVAWPLKAPKERAIDRMLKRIDEAAQWPFYFMKAVIGPLGEMVR
jgi:hypothetical protein